MNPQAFEDLVEKVDYIECQSRRNNVRIDGLAEDRQETWDATEAKARSFFRDQLGITTPLRIERAHRTGVKTTKTRPVVVKLTFFKDRELVLAKAKEKKVPGVFVYEDFSQRVINRRKALLPKLKDARDRGLLAYFSFDKLIIKQKSHQPAGGHGRRRTNDSSNNSNSSSQPVFSSPSPAQTDQVDPVASAATGTTTPGSADD